MSSKPLLNLCKYVEAFFRNLDWDHVNRQLRQAQLAREAAGEPALRG